MLKYALPGQGRAGVALAFLGSAEFRGGLVAGYYTELLNRSGSAGDQESWAASGLSAEQLRLAFESGTEFYTNG